MRKPGDDHLAELGFRLRIVMWVDGVMTGETLLHDDISDSEANAQMDEMMAIYLARAKKAEAAGSRWLIEIYDPQRGHRRG